MKFDLFLQDTRKTEESCELTKGLEKAGARESQNWIEIFLPGKARNCNTIQE